MNRCQTYHTSPLLSESVSPEISDAKQRLSLKELVVRVLADLTQLIQVELESLKREVLNTVRANVTRTMNEIIQKEILPPLRATALPSALIGLSVALIATAGLLFTFSGVYGWVAAGVATWLAFLIQGLILILVAVIMIVIAVALLARYAKRIAAQKATSSSKDAFSGQ